MDGSYGSRRRARFDAGWAFHLGDIPTPKTEDHSATYGAAKACRALGAAGMEYDDSGWRRVCLPHDWQVEQPFDTRENVDHGYKARGVAWYRRRFRLDEADRGRVVRLLFDGVATHCTVWVNGQLLVRNHCGYTGFEADASDVVVFGEPANAVTVRVDAVPFEGWWYEGAGIYRHVWLEVSELLYVPRHGVRVNPTATRTGWRADISTEVRNDGAAFATGRVSWRVLRLGVEIGADEAPVRARAGETVDVKGVCRVASPALWSPDSPNLYTLETTLWREGTCLERQETAFGFRTISFRAGRGFLLNGQVLKLKGTCNHQDHAGVGVALPDALHEFRVRRLKEMGSNAYRCAHNPPAPELLDACDRLGLLVMDENRHFNSAPEYLAQLREMVRRDRNHPCVVLWSLFNEEPLQGTDQGRRIAARMAREVKALDDSRPVTAAMNGGILAPDGVAAVVDVMGINYIQPQYDEFRTKFPGLPAVASENDCAFSTRGVYHTDPQAQVFDSYDEQKAGWGNTGRGSWQEIATRDFIAGIFVWTGFDYRGEPAPHHWPSINSHWGAMDTCGFAKDKFWLHRAQWVDDEPVLHLLPHWTWPGCEGQERRVMVFTNCSAVTLFLNGQSLGRLDVDRFAMAEWKVAYAPGELRAVGEWRGQSIEAAQVTAGPAAALEVIPDRPALRADGADAMPVTIRAVDAQGRFCPTAAPLVRLSVEGPVAVLGVGNGDPNCHEPDKAAQRSLFHGLAQAVLQAGTAAGSLRLTATADGLQAGHASLECRMR
jgi:beta-galactosidase